MWALFSCNTSFSYLFFITIVSVVSLLWILFLLFHLKNKTWYKPKLSTWKKFNNSFQLSYDCFNNLLTWDLSITLYALLTKVRWSCSFLGGKEGKQSTHCDQSQNKRQTNKTTFVQMHSERLPPNSFPRSTLHLTLRRLTAITRLQAVLELLLLFEVSFVMVLDNLLVLRGWKQPTLYTQLHIHVLNYKFLLFYLRRSVNYVKVDICYCFVCFALFVV